MRSPILQTVPLFVLFGQVFAQLPAALAAQVQNNTFNASYGPIDPSQAASIVASANFSSDVAEAILVAVDFERSNWAGSSTQLDPFYVDVPAIPANTSAGKPLKIQQTVETTLYTLPPGVALSRFIYTTKNFNGTVIPASAYVLWPYLPRAFPSVSGIPVVSWAHGASGWSSECGPSHIRNLWYQYSAPFTLALQGYAVVAADFAGLGIDHTSNSTFIPHQFGANPAAGNDVLYAVQAAQEAWPELSDEFVVMGHSQGGGAAWGAAENVQAREDSAEPVKGYLGTVTASPMVFLPALLKGVFDEVPNLGQLLGILGWGMKSIYPGFQLSSLLSPAGEKALEVLQKLQGCQSVGLQLYGTASPAAHVNPAWKESSELVAFLEAASTGGKQFKGPMVVLQGTADQAVPTALVDPVVNATCAAVPDSQLNYARFEGVTHVPVLYAGQRVWLDWIADRFNGVEMPNGCTSKDYAAALNGTAYQKELSYFIEYPLYAYETA